MSSRGIFDFSHRRFLPLLVLVALIFSVMPASTVAAGNVVSFPDHNLEGAIRETIGKPEGDIYDTDLDRLTSLRAGGRGISDLTGLEYCTSLKRLYLNANQVTDISPLSGLTGLTNLHLPGNQVADISPLSGLTSLTDLRLGTYRDGGNMIADISPLSGLTNLTDLYLSRNQVADTSPLSGLTSLTSLGLGSNQITDISPLSSLTNLTLLSIGRVVLSGNQNQISDISPLSGLTKLTDLRLPYGQISDVSPLSGLTSLIKLDLGTNQIASISPLSGLTNLEELWINQNQIGDISPLSGLTKLTYLEVNTNQIGDISPLSGLTKLAYLKSGSNPISNISPLSGLTSLVYLNLYRAQIADISSLAGLTNLAVLDLHSNQVSSIEPLVNNPGMAEGDRVYLDSNPLSGDSVNTWIPTLQGRGVTFCSESLAVHPPIRPGNVSPPTGTAGVSLTPTLQSSAFCDCTLSVQHAASQWQITTAAGDYANPVFDSATDSSNLISITIPAGRLRSSLTCFWRVRYRGNDDDAWSDWSRETSFTTGQAPVIHGLDPESGKRGQYMTVHISGSSFDGATAVSFGLGVVVHGFIVSSSTEMTAEITIDADAAEGTRDVSITTGTGAVTEPDGFNVTGSGGGICSIGAPATPGVPSEMTATLAAIGLFFGVWYWLVRRGTIERRSNAIPTRR